MLYLFVLSNIIITLGYIYLAFRVVPRVRVRLRRTKLGGIGFFLLCGATHTDMALAALFHPHAMIGDAAESWHMLAIHIPQAACVWLFVTGLMLEVTDYKLLSRDPVPRDAVEPAPPADPEDYRKRS